MGQGLGLGLGPGLDNDVLFDPGPVSFGGSGDEVLPLSLRVLLEDVDCGPSCQC